MPCAAMAASTTLRRALAAAGSANGSSAAGSWMMPASNAAWGSVRRRALVPKNVRAAISMP